MTSYTIARSDGTTYEVDAAQFDAERTRSEAEVLAEARAGMIITPLQGILTLGEAEWGKASRLP